MTQICTSLPSRRQRLRTYCHLKLQNRRLRWATAALLVALAILAVLALRSPQSLEPVPLGRGIAGVAPEVAAAPVAPAQAAPAQAAPAGERDIGSGDASFYGNELAGSPTASGERFDPALMTAAHRTLPLGSRLRVTHAGSGRSVVVRVNDRGPFHGNRAIDLSEAAARKLGMLASGTARVRMALIREA